MRSPSMRGRFSGNRKRVTISRLSKSAFLISLKLLEQLVCKAVIFEKAVAHEVSGESSPWL